MRDMDEQLSAYLDGMLDEAETARIEALISADPAVAARLEALALANSDFIETANRIDSVPASPGLAGQLARLHVEAARQDGASNVLPLVRRKGFMSFLESHRAVAAAAAIAAGLIAVQVSLPASDAPEGLPADGLILADSSLGRVFETAASGEALPAGKSLNAEVRFTFESANGSPCRVTDLSSAGGTSRLVGCREDAGWRIVVASFTPQTATGAGDTYQTASGPSAAAIETYLDSAMPGAPLSAADEAKYISGGWRSFPDRPDQNQP